MNAAVFVDFENLYLSLKNRYATPGLRTRELSLQVLEQMLVRLREAGNPMVLGRSYAGFDTYPGVEVAHDLALMGLDPQYVLISHSGKNSADVQLALDVARVLFRRSDIQMIVIVSGDRDFIPLARQVLEEGRELRVVAIPDTTSGDLRARVGDNRFWDALPWIEQRLESFEKLDAQLAASSATPEEGAASSNGHTPVAVSVRDHPGSSGPVILGRVPVTWQSRPAPQAQEDLLQQCVDLLVRAQIRHSSPDIWLSPFLKGSMSQYFSHLVHPERRALINELRSRGVIRVEERENAYAEHPYSVIVIDDAHPMAQVARARITRIAKP